MHLQGNFTMNLRHLAPGEDTGGRTLKRLYPSARDAARNRCTLDVALAGTGPRYVYRGLMIVRWLAFILLAGQLIFAHGCHPGDHDEELFSPIRIMKRAHE